MADFREAWDIATDVVAELMSDEYSSWDFMHIRDDIIKQLVT